MNPRELLQFVSDEGIKMVDLRFVDSARSVAALFNLCQRDGRGDVRRGRRI